MPEPTTTASAQARSSPITNRSAALPAAISLFDCGIDGIATTPSIVATKFANSARLVEAERAAVERGELGGELERRQAVGLPEQLERAAS